MARLYRGNTHWLFQQMKRNWIEIYGSDRDLMEYGKFRDKIESGTELMFAGDSYKSNKEVSSTAFNYDSLSVQRN